MKKRIFFAFFSGLIPVLSFGATVNPHAVTAVHTAPAKEVKTVYNASDSLITQKPEHFSLVLMDSHHKIIRTFSGFTENTSTFTASHQLMTSYIERISPRTVDIRTVKTGDHFIIGALKDHYVWFNGSISHLLRMKTVEVKGKTMQSPVVKRSMVNETFVLPKGDSVTLPIGRDFVKITRE